MRVQLLPIHLVVSLLLPEHIGNDLSPRFARECDEFILNRIGQIGFQQWYQYRKKERAFGPL